MTNGNRWKRDRKLLQPLFHSDQLKKFVKTFNSHAHVLVDKIRKEPSQLNVRYLMAQCTFDIVMESLTGVKVFAQTDPNFTYLKNFNLLTTMFADRLLNPFFLNETLYKLTSHSDRWNSCVKVTREFGEKIIGARIDEVRTCANNLDSGVKTPQNLFDRLLKIHLDPKTSTMMS